jgi:folate-binding protein YgfZ
MWRNLPNVKFNFRRCFLRKDKEVLLKRLRMYKLRAKVALEELPDIAVSYSMQQGLPDPRHPQLPRRVYGGDGEIPFQSYRAASLALGIPDSTLDFAPDSVVLQDAGYDLLNAVSFTKGCYVGQEVIARMHYKQIARKGPYLLSRDNHAERIAILRFEEGQKGEVSVDGVTYQAKLPEWMLPKLAQATGND